MVALSHPCNKLPIVAVRATSTAPLIFTENKDPQSSQKLVVNQVTLKVKQNNLHHGSK